ncbi:sterol desaturase family protein [uncultured Tateyamaria sp.]|uniref:sterol desaturase family protein n=1 Tax=uncultured Tateyamaria sp. TaxID=455651 RepID=UPI002614E7D7|nr:sterol desaturase family protein [uncultured Tateyamaria sp.]
MTPASLDTLGTQIDEVFFFIGIAILLIELAEVLFKGSHKGRTIAEMLVSASTQIPSIAVQVFILTSAYIVYYILAEIAQPWQIPLTWWGILLAVIAADLTYYWEHRIAHEVRVLWTQHAVHHSSRDYNIITGIRFGPLEGVWSLIAHIPLVFFGFSPEMIFFGIIVVLAYQTWIHTEVIGKLGWFDKVMNSPANHRVHHGCDDKYIDKNYGGITVIWDQLFGTYQAEEETPRYGLKRDFDSRNPIRVWFSELPGLWHDVVNARSWGEAWRYLMRPPGWTPGTTSTDRSE